MTSLGERIKAWNAVYSILKEQQRTDDDIGHVVLDEILRIRRALAFVDGQKRNGHPVE